MKLLVSDEVIKTNKSRDLIPLECQQCKKVFYIETREIKSAIKRNLDHHKFCNRECKYLGQITLIESQCTSCCKIFMKKPSQKLRSKSGNDFCSRSCSAIYNNKHKTTGTRRSKLEVWLEEQLKATYPELEIYFNKKDAINSELDIYFPTLKLAVELNGIFHYEPIYGKDKLSSIQNNDNRKFQACLEQNIELIIIDTSSCKNFKIEKSKKYLQIIQNVINAKIGL